MFCEATNDSATEFGAASTFTVRKDDLQTP